MRENKEKAKGRRGRRGMEEEVVRIKQKERGW